MSLGSLFKNLVFLGGLLHLTLVWVVIKVGLGLAGSCRLDLLA